MVHRNSVVLEILGPISEFRKPLWRVKIEVSFCCVFQKSYSQTVKKQEKEAARKLEGLGPTRVLLLNFARLQSG